MRFAAVLVAFVAAAPLAARAQDTQEGQPADVLHRAIDTASQASALDVEGAMASTSNLQELLESVQPQDGQGGDRQFGFLRRMAGGGGMGPNGLFSGTIASNGDGMLVLENEGGTVETYRRGTRTVSRRTTIEDQTPPDPQGGEGDRGRGGPGGPGGFGGRGVGREAERVLALSWFSQNFGQLMNVSEGEREDVSGRSCRVFTANAPEELVRAEPPPGAQQDPNAPPEGAPPGDNPFGRGGRGGRGDRGGFGGQPAPLEEIRCSFWIDGEDGSLRKYRVDIVRGEPEWFDRLRQNMDMPADPVRSTSSYEVEIHGTHDGAVTFPAEIERYFQS